MKTVATVIGGIILIVVALFLGVLAGSAIGAFVGWVLGNVFVATFTKLTLLTGFAPYQLGVIGGFIGGFVRSVQTNTK